MRPRELQVDPINASCTEFRGFPNVREEYARLFKRPPVFNTRTKSWSAPPAKVTDLAAALESRGWLVTYSRPTLHVRSATADPCVEQPGRQRGLW